jgi:DNA methylase
MNKISTSESSSRLAVTYRPVGDLIPDPRNARTHPKRQIDQIRTSIETRRGDLVLDLFLGSGTTLMATDRAGRRFRGLDIDPAYVDVAIERWSARTGLKPHLEGPAS